MHRMWILSLAVVCSVGLVAPTASASLFLDSWGVSYGNWEPAGAAPAFVDYIVEDWTGGGGGYLGPGYGGDEYDIEAMYIGLDSDYAYFAVVTGFPIEGLWSQGELLLPGDIAIDLDDDGDYEFGVDVDAAGALRSTDVVWENCSMGGSPVWGGASDPWRVQSAGESKDLTGFSYASFYGRYAIEAKVDRDLFGGSLGGSYRLHHTMQCGNDVGDMAGSIVPEPGTLMLLGAGLMGGVGYGGIGRIRRRRRN